MPTIVAVAIGKAYRQATIDDPTNIPTWARRYINGFVTSFPHALGDAYTIDYRECPKVDLNNKVFTNQLQADYVLCLSTTVLTYAAQFYPAASNKPIVGICSHPEEEPFSGQGNVCGVSPARSDDAEDAYRNLLNTVSPQLPQEEDLSRDADGLTSQ
jgi:hypothetical protein